MNTVAITATVRRAVLAEFLPSIWRYSKGTSERTFTAEDP
jgi:hypothetical protein